MIIERSIYRAIERHLERREITMLVGARQAGKTTLMKSLMAEKKYQGKECLFFNLDFERDFGYFDSQEKLLQKISRETTGSHSLIFIDEIQRKENAGLFLKGIYDQDLPYKFIVSGSGSLELKEKIHESLAGRKRIFELSTVSFPEFVRYKTLNKYGEDWLEVLASEPSTTNSFLLEYINFGGYPQVVTEQNIVEKRLILQEILQSYLERDIKGLLNVDNTQAFVNLMRLLAVRTGYMIDYHSLSQVVGISTPTLKKYLWYAEKTFITTYIRPFFKNKEKEIVKSTQAYFQDLGLRNELIDQTGKIEDFFNNGMLFQNFVANILSNKLKNTFHALRYWRTKNKAEIDFVIDRAMDQLPIEVKAKHFKKFAPTRSISSFIDKYKPKEAWIITLSGETSFHYQQTNVRFLPWYRLFQEL